uniref:Uncharacterized protein n=1 Tax=Anopheles merus TaxID=30066 RepID=A0A182UVQ9_ANOME
MFTAVDMALIHFGNRITRFRLQLEKVSCDSFAVLEIVTASTPAPGKTGRLRFAFRCALALGHLAFRAGTGDRDRGYPVVVVWRWVQESTEDGLCTPHIVGEKP